MGNTLQKPTQISEKKPEEEHNDINGSASSTSTCEICIEPILLPSQKFKNGNNCSHPFCKECIIKYISVEIQDNNKSTITCPAPNCNHSLDPLSCCQLIPRQLFVKWCDLLCDSAVLGFDRCYCPNRDCSALVVNECGGGSSNVKRSKCPNCKKLFCFQCKLTWHAGYRCEESGEMRDRNDIAFGVLAERKKWMSCPTCHLFIDRTWGCRYIKCRCGTNFCYECGKNALNHGFHCTTPEERNIIVVLYLFCLWFCIIVAFLIVFATAPKGSYSYASATKRI